jgi:cytochrome P450
MDLQTWSAYAIAWLSTVVLFLIANHFGHRKLNLPPGPKPWPIIGNLNLIGSLPHQSIYSLSLKFGPIMQLHFGSFPVVVGSSAEMAKIILNTMDVTLAGRPKHAAGKYITYNYSDITWSPYGPYWQQAREICLTGLFSSDRLESYEHIRIEELDSLHAKLFKSSGKAMKLNEVVSTMSLNVITRMVLGKRYSDESIDNVDPKDFKNMLDELFLLNGSLNIGDWIPWLNFMDLQGTVKKMKKVSKKFDRVLEDVLEEHEAKRRKNLKNNYNDNDDPKEFKDMVDVLLERADDPYLEVKMERNAIKAFIQDMLAGGTETSAVTIEWAISELLKKPELFTIATEELDRVVGKDRWVSENDMLDLPFIEAIMKETMRLHPVAPMLVPRVAREDCKIAGYDVLKDTVVIVNIWTIGRDPKVWDNPEEFCPERFIGKDIDVKGQHFELLPFGSGRRMCPGYTLGLRVIKGVLANLIHGYIWRLPGEMKPNELNMEEVFGLPTPRKIPLEVVVEPRLPSHLYSL